MTVFIFVIHSPEIVLAVASLGSFLHGAIAPVAGRQEVSEKTLLWEGQGRAAMGGVGLSGRVYGSGDGRGEAGGVVGGQGGQQHPGNG